MCGAAPAAICSPIEPAANAPFSDGIDETWIHVQLAESVDSKAVDEVKRLLPSVLADARQVALDSTSMAAMLRSLATELDFDPEHRFPGSDRKDVAALLRWLADGHFVLLGYQRCQVHDGHATVDPPSRLGVLRLRTDVLPQLTGSDDLLVLAQATMSSYPAVRRAPVHRGGPRTRRGRRRSNTASSDCSPWPQ